MNKIILIYTKVNKVNTIKMLIKIRTHKLIKLLTR